jgi:RNA polymerase sigma-70 factor (ECF subfamily)
MNSSLRENDWAMWLRLAMAGDADAYRRFLQAIAPFVRTVVRSGCRGSGNESEIEDVVQEALLAIHLKRGTWDPARPVVPWIAAIARHKLIDAMRRRGRHVSVPIEDVADRLPLDDTAPELSASEIDRLLAELKPAQEEIVRSISIEGVSIRETAGRLRMTEGAVRVALHRALKTLGALYRDRSRED